MRHIFIFMLFLITLSCKAQSTIIDIVNRCAYKHFNRLNGSVYLKDISNVYQPFTGTWKWSEGNKEMTLVLIKQTKFHYNRRINNYYEDSLLVTIFIKKTESQLLIHLMMTYRKILELL